MSSDAISGVSNITSALSNPALTEISPELLADIKQTFTSKFDNSSVETVNSIVDELDTLDATSEALTVKIDAVYKEAKTADSSDNNYIQNLSDGLLQIVGVSGYDGRKQKDLVNSTIDSVMKQYVKGAITKSEILGAISAKLSGSSVVDSAALATLIDENGAQLDDLLATSGNIADMLDSKNVYKEKYNTIQSVQELLVDVGNSISNSATRDLSSTDKPYFSPTQESYGAELQTLYSKPQTLGTAKVPISQESTNNAAVVSLGQALCGLVEQVNTTLGSGTNAKKTTTYKWMMPSAKTAEELRSLPSEEVVNAMSPTNTNYSVVEKMYLAGYTYEQTASALSTMFAGAGISYDAATNKLTVPEGKDDAKGIYNSLLQQVGTLWGPDINVKRAIGTQPAASAQDSSSLGFSVDDTKYNFVADNNDNGVMDDSSELASSLNQIKSFDADNNGVLEGDELKNVKLLRSDQNLYGSGAYDFASAASLGITKIDLNSYAANSSTAKDLNGNTNVSSFDVTIGGTSVTAHQTKSTSSYLNTFYQYMYGSNSTVALSDDDVSAVLEGHGVDSTSSIASNTTSSNAYDSRNFHNIVKD